MPKTILYIAISLDGYIAGKDGDLFWLSPYQDVDYEYEAFFSKIGAIIEGRRTYEVEIKNGWENVHPVPLFVLSKDDPARKPARSDVVFTHDAIEEVLKSAKEKAGRKDVWIENGANVGQQFINRGLVDEIILTLIPVFLGEGIRLFDNMQAHASFSLQDVKRFDRSLAHLIYAVIREGE